MAWIYINSRIHIRGQSSILIPYNTTQNLTHAPGEGEHLRLISLKPPSLLFVDTH